MSDKTNKSVLTPLQKLFLKDTDKFRSVLLSQPQLDLLNWIVHDWRMKLSSYQVAGVFEISLQSASVKLKVLWEKGYLDRVQVSSNTGGIEYIYRAKS